MKTLKILLIIFWSQIVCSQTTGYSNKIEKVKIDTINLSQLNKTLFDYMNKWRSSIGVDQIVFSNETFKKISLPTSKRMSEEGILRHYNFDNDSIGNAIASETEKKYGVKAQRRDNGKLDLFGYFEVCLAYPIELFKPNMSYEDLVKEFIKIWDNSPEHSAIISHNHGYLEQPGLGACSVSIGKKYFFTSFDFVILMRR